MQNCKIIIINKESFELLTDYKIKKIINDYKNENFFRDFGKTTTNLFLTNYVSVTEINR